LCLGKTQNYLYVEEYWVKKGRHCHHPCISNISNLLCDPLLKHLAAPHFGNSAVPCWQKCLRNDGPGAKILVLPVSQSQPVWPFQTLCISHIWDCVPSAILTLILLTLRILWANNASKWQMRFNSAYKGLNRCPFKWQCPVSSPIITLSS
jgi:hypothetical protein